jgi:hypothetical protein
MFSILCDIEYGLCLCERIVVFHTLCCELIIVRINVVIWAKVGRVKMVNTVKARGCSNLIRTES